MSLVLTSVTREGKPSRGRGLLRGVTSKSPDVTADARARSGSRSKTSVPGGARRLGGIEISVALPPYARGMRIGLFGGTFDPPHAAHRAACLLAMRRLGLDRVWWMVTPGNPLKNTRGLAPLWQRVAAARALANHPRIDVTDFEAQLGTRYTYETISYLVRRCRGVRFVWIMGADNLRSFHRWQRWRDIAALVPIAVVDRLGPSFYAAASVGGQAFARARLPERAAKTLPGRKPPAWAYLHGLKSPLSSTALRAARASKTVETVN